MNIPQGLPPHLVFFESSSSTWRCSECNETFMERPDGDWGCLARANEPAPSVAPPTEAPTNAGVDVEQLRRLAQEAHLSFDHEASYRSSVRPATVLALLDEIEGLRGTVIPDLHERCDELTAERDEARTQLEERNRSDAWAQLCAARAELVVVRAQRDALRDSLRDARERLAGEVPSLRQQADVVAYKGNEYHAYGLNGIASGIEEALVVMDELLREDQEAPK